MSQITLSVLFLGVAAILLFSNLLRADVIALMLALAFGLSGILTQQEAFSGFSRSAVIIMLSAFILAEGLRRTGIAERIGIFIIKLFGQNESRLIFGVMSAAAFLSFFMNNIAAASLLAPALAGVAKRSNISLSKLLMPLAFGTILGGMTTLFTTTNLVVNGLLAEARLPVFGIVDFAPVGIPLALTGILFMTIRGKNLLPKQSPSQRHKDQMDGNDLLSTYQLSERLVRAKVNKNGALNGVTLEKSGLRELYHLNVIAIQRNNNIIPSLASATLQEGDILLLTARNEDIFSETLQTMLEILPLDKWQKDYLSTPDLFLIEAAIAPRSHLAAQTLQEIRFEQKYKSKILAVWRGGRSYRTRLENFRLNFGDGLLIQGNEHSLNLLKTEPGLMLLAEAASSTQMLPRSWLAALLTIFTLSLAAFLPNMLAEIMLGGALLMILFGVMNMDQAYHAVDWRSIFLVAGMLPAGIAINKTGLDVLVSNGILTYAGHASPMILITIFVLSTVLLTQIINGVATVTIMAPIAIITAVNTGINPQMLTMAVAISSSMAFISPIGHAVNVMVMGAGGYTFKDYARVGVPLTVFLVVLLIFIIYNFY